MFTITVQHKHCGCTKTLQGESIAKIYKDNGLDLSIWTIERIEYND